MMPFKYGSRIVLPEPVIIPSPKTLNFYYLDGKGKDITNIVLCHTGLLDGETDILFNFIHTSRGHSDQ